MGQQQQQQHNYFTNMIKRYNGNTEFVSLLKPEQIQRSAKERIFREMVRGQIDYSLFGIYFENPKFLENLIVAAQNELENYNTIFCALDFYDNTFPGNSNVFYNKGKFIALINIFSVLCDRLYKVKMDGNIGHLTDIQYVLKNYSKYI